LHYNDSIDPLLIKGFFLYIDVMNFKEWSKNNKNKSFKSITFKKVFETFYKTNKNFFKKKIENIIWAGEGSSAWGYTSKDDSIEFLLTSVNTILIRLKKKTGKNIFGKIKWEYYNLELKTFQFKEWEKHYNFIEQKISNSDSFIIEEEEKTLFKSFKKITSLIQEDIDFEEERLKKAFDNYQKKEIERSTGKFSKIDYSKIINDPIKKIEYLGSKESFEFVFIEKAKKVWWENEIELVFKSEIGFEELEKILCKSFDNNKYMSSYTPKDEDYGEELDKVMSSFKHLKYLSTTLLTPSNILNKKVLTKKDIDNLERPYKASKENNSIKVGLNIEVTCETPRNDGYGSFTEDEYFYRLDILEFYKKKDNLYGIKSSKTFLNHKYFSYDKTHFKTISKNKTNGLKMLYEGFLFYINRIVKDFSIHLEEATEIYEKNKTKEEEIKLSSEKGIKKIQEIKLELDKDSNGVLDITQSDDFFNLLKQNEKEIIDNDKEYIKNFVKLSNYLKTKRENLQTIFKLFDTLTLYEDVDEVFKILKNSINSYNNLLFQSIAMITLLKENEMIDFYEVYELFDQLNVFDSKFERDLLNQIVNLKDELKIELDKVGSKIEKAIDRQNLKLSEMSEMFRENFTKVLTKMNDSDRKIVSSINNLSYVTSSSINSLGNKMRTSLDSINTSIDVNNLLTGIQTYQMYKVNLNTKSLRIKN
jgi:hypothetical protein